MVQEGEENTRKDRCGLFGVGHGHRVLEIDRGILPRYNKGNDPGHQKEGSNFWPEKRSFPEVLRSEWKRCQRKDIPIEIDNGSGYQDEIEMFDGKPTPFHAADDGENGQNSHVKLT